MVEWRAAAARCAANKWHLWPTMDVVMLGLNKNSKVKHYQELYCLQNGASSHNYRHSFTSVILGNGC